MSIGTGRQKNAAFACLELAPFDSDQWALMLRATAIATNASNVHLIGRDNSNELPTNLYSEPLDDAEWFAAGGADPACNPYMAAALHLKQGQYFSSSEVQSSEKYPRNRCIDDILERNDIPHLYATKVFQDDRGAWYMARLSSSRQGSIDHTDKTTFEEIGIATALAIRRTMAMRNEGAKVLAGAFNALSLTAFVCDAFGGVLAMSEKAERFVRAGDPLRMRGRVLEGHTAAGTAALDRAILAAARHQLDSAPDTKARIPLVDAFGHMVATAQAIPLPRDRCNIGRGAAALLVVDEQPKAEPQLLARGYGLTGAECRVAELLLQGWRIDKIAHRRSVSHETVRSQSKSIYSKLDVRGQIDLIARFEGAYAAATLSPSGSRST